MLTAFRIGPFPLLSAFFYFYPSQSLDPGFYRPLLRKRKKVGKHEQSELQMKDTNKNQNESASSQIRTHA